MWFITMHRDHFIRRKQRLHVKFGAYVMKSHLRLSSLMTVSKQYFALPGILHCNFYPCLQSWSNAVRAPLNNPFLKSSIEEVGKRCRLTL